MARILIGVVGKQAAIEFDMEEAKFDFLQIVGTNPRALTVSVGNKHLQAQTS